MTRPSEDPSNRPERGIKLTTIPRSTPTGLDDPHYWWATIYLRATNRANKHRYRYEDIRAWLREFCKHWTTTTYLDRCDTIQVGGKPGHGARIQIIQDPSNPVDPIDLMSRTLMIARSGLEKFHQHKVLIVASTGVFSMVNHELDCEEENLPHPWYLLTSRY